MLQAWLSDSRLPAQHEPFAMRVDLIGQQDASSSECGVSLQGEVSMHGRTLHVCSLQEGTASGCLNLSLKQRLASLLPVLQRVCGECGPWGV